MKKLLLAVSLGLTALTLTGCGYESIPPAHKAKILDKNGFSVDTLEPGRRWIGINERLVLIQTGTEMYKENMKVLLADRLEIAFDVRARVYIGGDDNTINAMFNDMTISGSTLRTQDVYNKYGQMLVRSVSRNVMDKYSVDDIHKNRTKIESELKKEMSKAFSKTPLVLSDVTLGQVQYPDVVTKAVAMQKERQLAIETQQNQVKIDLEKKKGEEQIAQAQYRIKMLEAKRIRDYNKMIAEGITPDLLKLRALEVQEKLAEKGNNTVFMPFEAMNSTGAQVRMYSK